MSPNRLILQIQKSNPEALQYVYNHCKEYCIRCMHSRTECTSVDAEDIFMDAILIFRENVMTGKLTEVKHLRAYMYKICLNIYREQQYNESRRQKSEDAIRISLYENDVPIPDDMLLKKAIAMQAFRYLGANCRCILQYYYFDQLPLEDIAKKMNLANSNVAKVTKSRCYKKWVEAVASLKQKK